MRRLTALSGLDALNVSIESRKEARSICNTFMYFSKININVLRPLDPNACAFPGSFGWLFLKK